MIVTICPRAVAAALLVGALVARQESRSGESDPRAVEVVERGLRVLGGRDRIAGVRTVVRRGIVTVRGVEGTIEEWIAMPGRRRQEILAPGFCSITVCDGDVVKRFDGDVVRTLSGGEREDWVRRPWLWPEAHAESLGLVFELAGAREWGGRREKGVRVRAAAGRSYVDWYDEDSGRLVRREEHEQVGGAKDPVLVSTSYGDYAEILGVGVARRLTRAALHAESRTEFREIVLDAEIAPGIFDVHERRPEERLAIFAVPPRPLLEPDPENGALDLLQIRLSLPNFVPRAEGELTYRLLAGERAIETRSVRDESLAALRAFGRDGGALRGEFGIVVPVGRETAADALEVRVEEHGGAWASRAAALRVPIARHEPKTEYNFPFATAAVPTAGHGPREHHASERAQAYAWDLAPCDAEGRVLVPGAFGIANEEYVGFGAPVLAPADGIVGYARNDVPDNPRPGEVLGREWMAIDPARVFGNGLVIEHGPGEFLFLGHFQRGSLAVRPGDRVVRGQLLGRVGNSGQASAPHLHIHQMDGPGLLDSSGIPLRFRMLVDVPLGRRVSTLRVGVPVRPLTGERAGERSGGRDSRPASRSASVPAGR